MKKQPKTKQPKTMKAFKFALRPSLNATRKLEQSLETHRRIYNDCLALRRDTYKNEKKTLKKGQLYTIFKNRRNADRDKEKTGQEGPHWLAHIAAVSMRDTIYRLDKAFENFFRRVKQGKKPGYPRFRSRDRYNSIPFDNYNSGCALVDKKKKVVRGNMEDANLSGFRLKLFGIGMVKIRLHRSIQGKIKTVCVKKEADKWYAVFTCDMGKPDIPVNTNPPVGIDVGIENFLTDSNGTVAENHRFLNKSQKSIKKLSKKIALRDGKKNKTRQYCKRGSRRRNLNKKKLQRLHTKVKNQRRDNHHKISLNLVRKHGLIAVENLNILGMLGNRRLSRAIADAGWHQFLQILKYKAESAGTQYVEVDPRFTSQRCNVCGHCEADNRPSQAVFKCLRCGHEANADHNAARNILERALRQVRSGPAGVNVAPLESEQSGSKGKRSPKTSLRNRNLLRGGGASPPTESG